MDTRYNRRGFDHLRLGLIPEAKGGDHGGRVFAVWREISQGRRELAFIAAFPQIEPGRIGFQNRLSAAPKPSSRVRLALRVIVTRNLTDALFRFRAVPAGACGLAMATVERFPWPRWAKFRQAELCANVVEANQRIIAREAIDEEAVGRRDGRRDA
jgi:hypothetical protein